ncbi:MAG: nitroreductase [Rhodospirillaceae bacterium]
MDVLTAINSRASAIKLAEPGPTRAQLDTILKAGIRAPDHGRLSPWRFVILEGEKRKILADAMSAMRKRLSPEVSDEDAQKEGLKALRAPTIVAVAVHTAPPGKIPEIERIVAVGAAMENMILAAHALGLGTMWKTGQAAYDPEVKKTIGLAPEDHVIGFLYLGTAQTPGVPRESKLDGCVIRL